jgi:hypothetical protein
LRGVRDSVEPKHLEHGFREKTCHNQSNQYQNEQKRDDHDFRHSILKVQHKTRGR